MPLTLSRTLLVSALAASLTASAAFAQQSFIARWQARATATQAAQPHWVTPLATVTPRLEQEFRSDFNRQITPTHTTTWIYGNGKGLELIPQRNIELLFNVPPYIQHNSASKDGFGDTVLLMKYRIFARNEQHGNAIITAFFGGSIPTGSYSNGSTDATVRPTLAFGKGYRRADFQSTIGAILPVANTSKLGRPIEWNTALQYKTGEHLWPEVEFNTTFYEGGPHDGNTQNFITPGIVGHWKLHNRLGLTLGAGMQIASSRYHAYNHGLILSARMPF
jgi:opacity protein-like surface antigen